MVRIASDSPLRRLSTGVSERQIVFLDGIRYSADMAAIALDRLWRKLCAIDADMDKAESTDIAEAALDAWSIVDAAHRMHDLVANLPGLPNDPWRRVFLDRMRDAVALRDHWQHQITDALRVVDAREQAWGALAWAQHQGDRPTGKWFLAVAGSSFKGSSWLVAGPVDAIPREDTRRMRLLHAGRELYLARTVGDIFEAAGQIEAVLSSGRLRLVGTGAQSSRQTDDVSFVMIQVAISAGREGAWKGE